VVAAVGYLLEIVRAARRAAKRSSTTNQTACQW
jgi:hypothetical protein